MESGTICVFNTTSTATISTNTYTNISYKRDIHCIVIRFHKKKTNNETAYYKMINENEQQLANRSTTQPKDELCSSQNEK